MLLGIDIIIIYSVFCYYGFYKTILFSRKESLQERDFDTSYAENDDEIPPPYTLPERPLCPP